MDIENLTIGEARKLASWFGGAAPAPHPAHGKYCLIRTYSAGVHIGTVASASGREVHLRDARRIWNWSGALSCSEIAAKGITGGKVSVPVLDIYLTEAIEIIPFTEEAKECLRKL